MDLNVTHEPNSDLRPAPSRIRISVNVRCTIESQVSANVKRNALIKTRDDELRIDLTRVYVLCNVPSQWDLTLITLLHGFVADRTSKTLMIKVTSAPSGRWICNTCHFRVARSFVRISYETICSRRNAWCNFGNCCLLSLAPMKMENGKRLRTISPTVTIIN